MNLGQLRGDIDSATIANNDVRDKRLLTSFPSIVEGWHEVVQDIIENETDASMSFTAMERPDDFLIPTLKLIDPSLVTVISERPDDPNVIAEIKEVCDTVRPDLIVALVHDGDPFMNGTFFDAMHTRVEEPWVEGKREYLDYVHSIPLRSFLNPENIGPIVREVIDHLARMRSRRL